MLEAKIFHHAVNGCSHPHLYIPKIPSSGAGCSAAGYSPRNFHGMESAAGIFRPYSVFRVVQNNQVGTNSVATACLLALLLLLLPLRYVYACLSMHGGIHV